MKELHQLTPETLTMKNFISFSSSLILLLLAVVSTLGYAPSQYSTSYLVKNYNLKSITSSAFQTFNSLNFRIKVAMTTFQQF
jgi:hypothetical protein